MYLGLLSRMVTNEMKPVTTLVVLMCNLFYNITFYCREDSGSYSLVHTYFTCKSCLICMEAWLMFQPAAGK